MPTDTAIFPESEFECFQSRLQRLGLEPSEHVLIAALGEKKLYLVQGRELLRTYPVSSGARPRSCKADSQGTPWGLHCIAAMYGHGAPAGTIFEGRLSTGRRWQDYPDAGDNKRCLVTTRILRLRGLEPGLNAGPGIDSFDRFIYIHGTNHPERFPENISAGCLNMLDDELVELFDYVKEGSLVWLSEPEEVSPVCP